MCALTRPHPIKRAAVAFASATKEAPVAAQPPAPAITSIAKKPAAVCRPIATKLTIMAMPMTMATGGDANDDGDGATDDSATGDDVGNDDGDR